MNVTSSSEQFAFEGPLGLTGAGLLCAAVVVVLGILLWRERQVTGIHVALLFFLLRTLTVLTVVWMLLAPARVTTDRSQVQRTLVVAADVSQSMGTVDNVETVNDLRWLAAGSDSASTSVLATFDHALVDVQFAERSLQQAARSAAEYRTPAVIDEYLRQCGASVQRAGFHLERASVLSSNAATRQSLERIQSTLRSRELTALLAPDQAKRSFGDQQRDELAEAIRILEAASRQIDQLAQTDVQVGPMEGRRPDARSSRLSRIADVADRLEKRLDAELDRDARVQFALFDDRFIPLRQGASLAQGVRDANADQKSVRLQPDEAPRGGTNISAVLEWARAQTPDTSLASVILFTDAAQNQPGARDPQDVAAELTEVPVHVVPIGSTRPIRDVILFSVVAPAVMMQNDELVVEAHVQAFECAGDSCTVELLEGDQVIEFESILFDSPVATQRVTFHTRLTELGPHEFQVRVSGVAREQSDANNSEVFTVDVTRKEIRVLLADGLPRWEFRYLQQLFRRDETVKCDELLFSPRVFGTGDMQGKPAFPTSAGGWARYDAAILGDVSVSQLPVPAQEALREFVTARGGTLILIAGDDSMPAAYAGLPLAALVPVQPRAPGPSPADGYRLFLTAAGQRHQALMIGDTELETAGAWEFVNRNVPLFALSEFCRPIPAAHTLIAAAPQNAARSDEQQPANAFLCWQPAGRGRVVYLSAPDSWRLRSRKGDRLHHRFWGQLLRWAISRDLSAGPDLVQIRTDMAYYVSQSPVEVTVRLGNDEHVVTDANVSAVAERGDVIQKTVELSADDSIPGRFVGRFEGLPAGVYTLRPQGAAIDELLKGSSQVPETTITVRALHQPELVDTRCRLDVARKIADASGGQVVPPTGVDEIFALTNFKPIVTETTQSRPVWAQWKYLWIVFVCLHLEWGIRKWMGLS